jgi:uncharacterized protein DUF4838
MLPRSFFITILFAAICTALHSALALTLVEDGQPRAVIVLADQPSAAASLGARILREHVRQMSGADLPIANESKITGDASKERAWVLVGGGKLAERLGFSNAKLGPGAIAMHAKGNVLTLLGADARTPADPDGSRYAVVAFLEEKLGVRWLWPGELGKVVPKKKMIAVEDFDRTFSPPLAQRRIRDGFAQPRADAGLANLGFTRARSNELHARALRVESESGSWFAWQRLGGTMEVGSGHAFGQLWEKYGREHPDWFALQPDGSRDQSRSPGRARLCKSNPELIAAIAHEKIEELNKNPKLLGVSLAPNDGGPLTFCTCSKCEALDAKGGRKVALWDFSGGGRRDFEHVSLTDRMVWFWNQIAEQVTKVHPDKLFTVDAYSVYSAPPVERALHPNFVVRFVPMSYTDERARQQALRDWDAWSEKAAKIYFRPNLLLAGRRDGMPLLYPHKFAEDFRHLAHHKMIGTDFDSCMHNWATQGLNYYVVARLHWDPDQDVDAMIDDYCRAGFGAAAKSVRKYFDKLESLTNEVAKHREELYEAAESKKLTRLTPFTREAIGELRDLLASARREAGDDETVLKRIAFLEDGLRWTDVETRVHAFLDAGDAADKAAAQNALDERFALMRELFEKDNLALNVAYISWGEDAYLARLKTKAKGK